MVSHVQENHQFFLRKTIKLYSPEHRDFSGPAARSPWWGKQVCTAESEAHLAGPWLVPGFGEGETSLWSVWIQMTLGL